MRPALEGGVHPTGLVLALAAREELQVWEGDVEIQEEEVEKEGFLCGEQGYLVGVMRGVGLVPGVGEVLEGFEGCC